MDRDDQIAELFGSWQEAIRRGMPLTPDEVCRDCPELLGEFRDLLPRLAAVNALFDEEGPEFAGGAPGQAEIREFRSLVYHKQGGLGVIMVGEETDLDRTVAVKRMKPRVAADPAACDRFVEEAALTARLEHPGIVPIYRKGFDRQGRPYYAMRFIQGETFGDAVRRYHDPTANRTDPAERHIEFRRLLRAFVGVCQTVAYAHSRGVVHRDLKPENIMLGAFGETLVVDWGLAKRLDRQTVGPDDETVDFTVGPSPGRNPSVDGKAKGSPAFMSPEQARGDWRRVGPASDIYSLGATLYVLLTGSAPVTGTTVEEIIDRVKSGHFPSPIERRPDVDKALAAICRKAMAAEPEDRYRDAREFAADIERHLADEPVNVWREPLSVRVRRWVRRHRTAVAAAVTGLLIATAAASVIAVLAIRYGSRERAAAEQLAAAYGRLEEAHAHVTQNFEKARSAVRDLTMHAMSDPQLINSGAIGARQSLLRTAQRHYESLLTEESGDQDEIAAELTTAHYLVGHFAMLKGTPDEARREFTAAAEILRRPTPGAGKSAERLQMLGLALLQLGTIETDAGKPEAGLPNLDESLRVLTGPETAGSPHAEVLAFLASMAAVKAAAFAGPDSSAAGYLAQARGFADRIAKHDTRQLPDETRILIASALNDLALFELQAERTSEAEKLNDRARQLLEPLIGKFADFGDVEFLAATLEMRRAEILSARGKSGVPELCAEVRARLEKLARANPESTIGLTWMAASWSAEAAAWNLAGKPDRAAAAFSEARKLYEDLRKKSPQNRELQQHHAETCRNLASMLLKQEDLKPAREALDAARAELEDLRRNAPPRPPYAFLLGAVENTAGLLAMHEDQLDSAVAHFEKSLELTRDSLAARPDGPTALEAEATTLQNLGATWMGKKRADQAYPWFEKAVAAWTRLERDHPDTMKYRAGRLDAGVFLADALSVAADDLWDAKRSEAALPLWKQADALFVQAAAAPTPSSRLQPRYKHHLVRGASRITSDGVAQNQGGNPAASRKTLEEALAVWARAAAVDAGDSALRQSRSAARWEYACACRDYVDRAAKSNAADTAEWERAIRAGLEQLEAVPFPWNLRTEFGGLRKELQQRLDSLQKKKSSN